MKADRPSGAVSYRPAKRFVDKAVSIVLLILLAPVFAVALVAIALDGLLARRDRGPRLHRVRRVSAGREFDLLKFRTLKCTVLEQAQDPHEDARLLERHPGNLTWAGRRILKPWYLDELPQLVNVLRADMSLVGPRRWPLSMVRDQVAAGTSTGTTLSPAGRVQSRCRRGSSTRRTMRRSTLCTSRRVAL